MPVFGSFWRFDMSFLLVWYEFLEIWFESLISRMSLLPFSNDSLKIDWRAHCSHDSRPLECSKPCFTIQRKVELWCDQKSCIICAVWNTVFDREERLRDSLPFYVAKSIKSSHLFFFVASHYRSSKRQLFQNLTKSCYCRNTNWRRLLTRPKCTASLFYTRTWSCELCFMSALSAFFRP